MAEDFGVPGARQNVMSRPRTPWPGRRRVLSGASAIAIGTAISGAQAQSRVATPPATEGPFYPVDWQGDVDNDLVVVRGAAARAQGQIVHVGGRVLSPDGQPLGGSTVEIWQSDSHGIYRHPSDERGGRRRDAGFQGRGRTVTDPSGRYSFRTLRPVAYANRTPHIHYRIVTADGRILVTQMYVEGEPLNARDFLLGAIRDPQQRAAVLVRFVPADGVEPGAQAATFDIVIG